MLEQEKLAEQTQFHMEK